MYGGDPIKSNYEEERRHHSRNAVKRGAAGAGILGADSLLTYWSQLTAGDVYQGVVDAAYGLGSPAELADYAPEVAITATAAAGAAVLGSAALSQYRARQAGSRIEAREEVQRSLESSREFEWGEDLE